MKRLFLSLLTIVFTPLFALSTELIIVFDDSGSMQGQRIEHAREATKELIRQALLGKDITDLETIRVAPLNIQEYTMVLNEGNVTSLMQTVEGIEATGGTPLAETMLRSFQNSTSQDVQIFAFTDGQASGGTQSVVNTVNRILADNKKDRVDIRILQIGDADIVNTLNINIDANSALERYFKAYHLQNSTQLAGILKDLGRESINRELAKKLRGVLSKTQDLQNMKRTVEWNLNRLGNGDRSIQEAYNVLNKVKEIESELMAFAQKPDSQKSSSEYVSLLKQLFDRSAGNSLLQTLRSQKYQIAQWFHDYEQSTEGVTKLVNDSRNLLSYVEGIRNEHPADYANLPQTLRLEIESIRTLYVQIDQIGKDTEKNKKEMQMRLTEISDIQNEINKVLLKLSKIPFEIERATVRPDVLAMLQNARVQAGYYFSGNTITYTGTHLFICEDDVSLAKDIYDNPNVRKHVVSCNGKDFPSYNSGMHVVNNGTIIDLTEGRGDSGGATAESFTNNGRIIKSAISRDKSGNQVFTLIKNNGEIIYLEDVQSSSTTPYLWAQIDNETYVIFNKDMTEVYVLRAEEIRLLSQSKGFLTKAGLVMKLLAQGTSAGLTTVGGSVIALAKTLANQEKGLQDNRQTLDRNIELHMGWLKNTWVQINTGKGNVEVPKALLPVIKEISETL